MGIKTIESGNSMSWDVVLIKTEKNKESFDDIIEGVAIPFEKEYAVKTINTILPETDTLDSEWLSFDNGRFAIEFNLADKSQITLYIHVLLDDEESEIEKVIESLCSTFDCRAFDTTTGEFM